ncbi:hypothetical protein O0L34_g7434 [Tuta absoluta]|nr:hypothetical protein O0L34_g7434 [Tuta absoluta]
MCTKLIDADLILSHNEQWMKLDQDWKAVDLETEEDCRLSPVFSTLDLRKTTFDSSFLMKKVRRKVGRQVSKKSIASSDLDYKEFLNDLEDEKTKDLPLKQFYFISGQILSALSVEEICDKIDDIFKSVERLCSATSTIRKPKKKPVLPDLVQCSISATDLSFDDTEDPEKEKNDDDDVDRYIDEAFDHLNSTIASLAAAESMDQLNESTKITVTTLVKKFSNILKSPVVQCSPRKAKNRQIRSEKFRELAEFWNRKAMENN